MPYYVDLSKISLDQYKEKLIIADLVPSRQVLKEDIYLNFTILKNAGINNTEELYDALKTKKRVQNFATEHQIDENYLTILIRELKGYRQPPVKIKDFFHLAPAVISKLEGIGLKNTQQLYEHIKTKDLRKELAIKTKIDTETINELAKLTDLSRVRWVNHTFAYALVRSGIESVKQLSETDFEQLHILINETNRKLNLYKANIGVHDMKITVEAANELPIEVDPF